MTETCLICDELMGDLKNDLIITSEYSERPIYMMFESCMGLRLPPDVIESAGVCQNCLIKFNEIDEHQTIAEKIQTDLIDLYNNSVSNSMDVKKEFKDDGYNVIEINFPEEIPEAPKTINKSKKQRTPKEPKPKIPKVEDDRYTVLMIDGKRCFQCHVCNKIILRRPKEHLQIHTTERNYKCEECGAAFKRSMNLNAHRRKIHMARTYHHCDICGNKYTSRTLVRKHMETFHLQRRDYICSVCGKAFSTNTTLNAHMHTHQTRERNIICNICGFRTYANAKLKRHMMSHTGERNYSCNICGKQFLYSYNVTQHINYVHKGIRYKVDEAKLTCHVCGLKFPKQWRVRSHLKEVHGIDEEGESLKDETLEVVETYEDVC